MAAASQVSQPTTTEDAGTNPGRRARRRARFEASLGARGSAQAEARTKSAVWAPKWRKLLTAQGVAPTDFTEFDRTVRGMLNRISTENASRLLPLEPSLRGGELMPEAGGDCPQWWAARFAGLMLSSYLEVIHTNRFARGLAVRSADNVLPEYLDAMAPMLAQSPRVVTALMAWFAKQLEWHDLTWPTTRLLLLAASEERDPDTLPPTSLGRLPPHLVLLISSFLTPPTLPAAAGLAADAPVADALPALAPSSPSSACGSPESSDSSPASQASSQSEKTLLCREEKKDIVAVLVHLIIFSPGTIWPRLSAFGISLAESSLVSHEATQEHIYLASSVIAAIAQRMESKVTTSNKKEIHRHCVEEIAPLSRLGSLLKNVTEEQRQASKLTPFVDCRTQVAIEHVERTQATYARHLDASIAVA